jgi:hypothetical protein
MEVKEPAQGETIKVREAAWQFGACARRGAGARRISVVKSRKCASLARLARMTRRPSRQP